MNATPYVTDTRALGEPAITTSTTQPKRIVIVGAGLAGATAAGALRDHGFDGEITLFGQEPRDPYQLPSLSKAVLLGQANEPDWVHKPSYYRDRDIQLRPDTRITELRPVAHTVLDAGGGEHRYDRLLLATGSQPRTLPALGEDGAHLLRTWDDALTLREKLLPDARVVIVGAGWIGCEVAAAARDRGAQVSVIDPLPLPLRRVLGDDIGQLFRDLHLEHGVQFHLGTGAAGIDTRNRTRVVRLDDGAELPADVVVVGVGAAPRTELAEQAGLDLTAGGMAVDAALRTCAPDIYAIGDIAAHDHPRYQRRVRIEHWANAKNQGAHVAGNLLGGNDPYTASPYFFSDQYDLGCEYRGLADPTTDQLVVRGELSSREFIAFWLHDGHVTAAMNVNSWDHGDALQALVDTQAQVSAQQLREADLPTLTV